MVMVMLMVNTKRRGGIMMAKMGNTQRQGCAMVANMITVFFRQTPQGAFEIEK